MSESSVKKKRKKETESEIKARLEGDKARRKKTDSKRKESGLELVKFYLPAAVIKHLAELAKPFGFDSKEANNRNGVVLSGIVSLCVQKMRAIQSGKPFDLKQEPEDIWVKQTLFWLRQIVRHRQGEGDEISEIAEFMNNHFYPNPYQVIKHKSSKKIPSGTKFAKWEGEHVNNILNMTPTKLLKEGSKPLKK